MPKLKQIPYGFTVVLVLSFLLAQVVLAQDQPESNSQASVPRVRPRATQPAKKPASPQLNESKKFVQEVVNAAVAIPQADPQDRLRILNSAIGVMGRTEPKLAWKFSDEALQIESRLIAAGETPSADVLATGYANCSAAAEFVQHIDSPSVAIAEQSLIAALSKCQKETLELVRARLDAAAQQGVFAPRLLMALMNKEGKSSSWSQSHFVDMFGSLPSPHGKSALEEAPNFAAMFANVAPDVERDAAGQAGLKLLTWLGKLDGPERNLAVNITTSSLKRLFGQDGYNKLLEKDVMAAQVARTAGAPGHVTQLPEEMASSQEAFNSRGKDQQEALMALPPSMRARQAAADGFAVGNFDKQAAEKYFDVAFSAANEAWEKRNSPERNAAGDDHGRRAASLIEEVSEAAAHIDPVDALGRAQHLQDISAQAIGMIAVARAVMTIEMRR